MKTAPATNLAVKDPASPATEAHQDRRRPRSRSAKMDEFMRKVSSSPRFDIANVTAQVDAAFEQQRRLASSDADHPTGAANLLPELTGSAKQVAWATTIRADVVHNIRRALPWIENEMREKLGWPPEMATSQMAKLHTRFDEFLADSYSGF